MKIWIMMTLKHRPSPVFTSFQPAMPEMTTRMMKIMTMKLTKIMIFLVMSMMMMIVKCTPSIPWSK